MIYHGANLIPEGLETGEFKINAVAQIPELEPITVIAYVGDKIPGGFLAATSIDISVGAYTVNGIDTSIAYIFSDNNEVISQFINATNVSTDIPYSEYIITIFTVPRLALSDFISDIGIISPAQYFGNLYGLYPKNGRYEYNQTPLVKTLNSRPSSIDGYTPRNKKLLTYPYIYLAFNPQNGSSKIYRYEDFQNATPSFKIISEVNPNPTVAFIPQNYIGNTGDSLTDTAYLNGYPTLSSRSDHFNSWIAQNAQIISLNMERSQYNYEMGALKTGMGMVGSMGSVLTGNFGALSNFVTAPMDLMAMDKNHELDIKTQMAQIEQQKMLPDKTSLGSSNATLLGYGFIDNDIFSRYSIKSQFAERIDKYFDMYGYLTNTLKVPNLNNRPNWNYVKTIGLNVTGNIPQMDLQTIKNIFDNGVTLWHNPSNFLNYSVSNR